MEKNMKKNYVYVYNWIFAVQQKLTQLYKSTIVQFFFNWLFVANIELGFISQSDISNF